LRDGPQSSHQQITSDWTRSDGFRSTPVAKPRSLRLQHFFEASGKPLPRSSTNKLTPSARAIVASCDVPFEQPYAGFEHLLAAEVSVAMQAWFVQFFVRAGEWPQALNHLVPPPGSPEENYRPAFVALFMHKKGDDYLTVFLDLCQVGHFPPTMLRVITALKNLAAPPPPPPPPPSPPAQPNIFG
jgi:putative ATP-dependent endonuclease of OLD family